MWFALKMMLRLLRLCGRARQDLILENLVLRHQLAVFERPGRRPALRDAVRRLWSLIAHEWHGWRDHLHVVQPATVVRWHRTAWRRSWRWRSRGGRPRIDAEARAALTKIVQEENPRWGVQRIVGELRTLGFAMSATTVSRHRAGIPRPSSPSWRTFLRVHAHEIWAADFFAVQTLTFKTVYVWDHKTRIAGGLPDGEPARSNVRVALCCAWPVGCPPLGQAALLPVLEELR